jgi:VCBS repeat-containing protein
VLSDGVHVAGLASTDGGTTWSGTLTADPDIGLESGTVSVSMTDPWQDMAGNPGSPGAGEAPVTLTVDDALPVLANDSNAVRAFQTVVRASVLANDTDPTGRAQQTGVSFAAGNVVAVGDPLHVTGISDASHGAGSFGGWLAGQYGTLTFNADGGYHYVADDAASLAEGRQADDVFTYTATDQHGNSAAATLDLKVRGHSGGAMDIVSYTAVESKTGDVISGALYDNTGKYTVGSSVTVPGADNLGGTWTYKVKQYRPR